MRRVNRTLAVVATVAALIVSVQQVAAATDSRPTGKGGGIMPTPTPGGPVPDANGGAATVKITYHNGPIMTGGVTAYYIWYGNWSGNTATSILTDFASNIGGSPYFNINTTYYNSNVIKERRMF